MYTLDLKYLFLLLNLILASLIYFMIPISVIQIPSIPSNCMFSAQSAVLRTSLFSFRVVGSVCVCLYRAFCVCPCLVGSAQFQLSCVSEGDARKFSIQGLASGPGKPVCFIGGGLAREVFRRTSGRQPDSDLARALQIALGFVSGLLPLLTHSIS